MERYFNTLKNECTNLFEFQTEEALYRTVEEFSYITYNHVRRTAIMATAHSTKPGQQHKERRKRVIGLLDRSASGMGVFVNGMAAQRCKAPLIKTDSSDRLQATLQGFFSHKCYKKG